MSASWFDEEMARPATAEITQVGRWTYSVEIRCGLSCTDWGHALGRRRAERKARRALARYRLMLQRGQNRTVITEEES